MSRLSTPIADGTGLIARDPWLEPHRAVLRRRHALYVGVKQTLLAASAQHGASSSLRDFANGHAYFGFTRGKDAGGRNGVWYREWAPGATRLALVGEFNFWDKHAHVMTRDDFGVWSVFVPDDGPSKLEHDAKVKVHVVHPGGATDRIPAYIRRVTFDKDGSNATGRVWLPPEYKWKHERPVARGSVALTSPERERGASLAKTSHSDPLADARGSSSQAPRIYEAHTGMALEEERVGTYDEFRELILPRIAKAGYNAVQLMAVQEHPYYGSFGYHVSNFFAVSSRFGTPDDFKRLVDAAHGLGLGVYLDLVHSHSVKNTVEGLNGFDGTSFQYFHAGPRGEHPAWDSLLFDYSKWEVLRFLLSNVRYWLEEYKIDGFRFDGVTSMLYLDHGLGKAFSTYDDYFGINVDEDAVTYLKLANEVAHETAKEMNASCVTIAEDMSGMPGTARPIGEGGLGFDYRLAMGIPDFWIKVLKERRDEEWSMGELAHTLTNRRSHEGHIAYAESHDQALVGDKTLAFWLMDAAMYSHMSKTTPSLVVDRGIALHKLIRLLTFFLGGEGWLNFMGNEFGHPEWIDFPRAGNHYSFKHCRRQWSLADDPLLRYEQMGAFDRALMKLDEEHGVLAAAPARIMQADELGKCLVFERANLVVAVNLHTTHSRTDWRIGVPPPERVPGEALTTLLNTDDKAFGGQGLIQGSPRYPRTTTAWDEFAHSVQVYVPSRSGQVVGKTPRQ